MIQATLSIFPKFCPHLSAAQLAGLVREVGLDTTNLVVRDGYWVSRTSLRTDLPAFMRVMRDEGLDVRFCTAGFMPEEVIEEPWLVECLAAEGIREFRMGYFRSKDGRPAEALDRARAELDRMMPVLERSGVRAVYQVHHGTLIPSASAAYLLARDRPSRWFGIELDPGNQQFEGAEDFLRSAQLLGDSLVAVGVKDVAVERDANRAATPSKGWTKRWAPIDEGVVNWHEVVGALAWVGFRGTMVFMPFYDEKDPARMTMKLKREVAYLRSILTGAK